MPADFRLGGGRFAAAGESWRLRLESVMWQYLTETDDWVNCTTRLAAELVDCGCVVRLV